jgi:hypothetical protein
MRCGQMPASLKLPKGQLQAVVDLTFLRDNAGRYRKPPDTEGALAYARGLKISTGRSRVRLTLPCSDEVRPLPDAARP